MTRSTALADRWLDTVLCSVTFSNIDGDQALSIELPDGIQHAAIMNIFLDISQIATMKTNPELTGPNAVVVKTATINNIDNVGNARWRQVSPTRVQALIDPDALVEWRDDESIRLHFAEIDTNAAPTADLTVLAKIVRVREQPALSQASPLRLVR